MTINEVTTRNGGGDLTAWEDPFAEFGAPAANIGKFYLRYKDGVFSYDKDEKPMPLGTRFAANMAGIMVGWIRWQNGVVAPGDKILEPLAARNKTKREDLGDNDPSLWKSPAQRDDPWQEYVQVELIDNTGQAFLFNSSSRGGVKGVRKLCHDFARERRSRPEQAPIIELGSDWYMHPDKSVGRVDEPRFPIVDWVDETTLTSVGNGADAPAGEAPDHLMPVEDPSFLEEEKPVETKASKPVPVLKAKAPRF